jgi:hypothetical protein
MDKTEIKVPEFVRNKLKKINSEIEIKNKEIEDKTNYLDFDINDEYKKFKELYKDEFKK